MITKDRSIYITSYCTIIAEKWKKHFPHMRFCQFLSDVIEWTNATLWYFEDLDLLDAIEDYIAWTKEN